MARVKVDIDLQVYELLRSRFSKRLERMFLEKARSLEKEPLPKDTIKLKEGLYMYVWPEGSIFNNYYILYKYSKGAPKLCIFEVGSYGKWLDKEFKREIREIQDLNRNA
jgi:hypothetical protein